MANYCSNYIEFSGETERIKKLARCFELLIKAEYAPTFTEACASVFRLLVVPEDSDYAYFGTKWFNIELTQEPQLEYEHTDEDTGEVYSRSYFVVTGDSAWYPPKKLTQKLCDSYGVQARHEYEESGNDFGGILTVDEKGHCEDEEYTYLEFNYKYNEDFWWDEVICQIEYGSHETFEDFARDNGYADLEVLKKAWKIAHENEDQ